MNLEVLTTAESPEASDVHPVGLPEMPADQANELVWVDLQRIWAECNFDSGKPRPKRDELYDG